VLLANLAGDALEEAGAVDEATRLACAALEQDHLLESGESDVALMASAVLMSTDRLDSAWRAWNAEIDRARRRGSILRFATAVTVRACLAYRCGQLADAEADARLGDDVHRELGLDLPRRFSLAFLVGSLVERGEVQPAAELLDAATVPMNLALLLDSRARLRFAQGRFAEAVEDFLACGTRLEARGGRHPGVLAWRSGAAQALQQLDQPGEARRLADEELDLARRLGVPRALGIAPRPGSRCGGGSTSPQPATPRRSPTARDRTGRGGGAATTLRQWSRRTHPERAAGRPHGRRRHGEPRDRAGPLRHRQDGRGPPGQHLPQARHLVPDRVDECTGRRPSLHEPPKR
jgi:tetratricopeptide (TPR) repeat protein